MAFARTSTKPTIDDVRQSPNFEIAQRRDGSNWYKETIHANWEQSYRIDEVLHFSQTDYQELFVFYNEQYGNVMVLDGAVQIAANDWHSYAEMFTIPLVLNRAPTPDNHLNVLIIGGGDGGVATTLLKHFRNISVTMVEIDGEVVEKSKEYLPEIADALIKMPENFTLNIQDGVAYVASEENKGKFDIAIVDCTDDNDIAHGLFGKDFHQNLRDCLKPNGIAIQQSGVLMYQLDEVKQTVSMMSELYQHPFVTQVPITTYPGNMTLVGASDLPLITDREEMQRRIESHGLQGTRHFNEGIYHSAYQLPEEHREWFAELCQCQNQHSPRMFSRMG